jgi:hypothetical protein
MQAMSQKSQMVRWQLICTCLAGFGSAYSSRSGHSCPSLTHGMVHNSYFACSTPLCRALQTIADENPKATWWKLKPSRSSADGFTFSLESTETVTTVSRTTEEGQISPCFSAYLNMLLQGFQRSPEERPPVVSTKASLSWVK